MAIHFQQLAALELFKFADVKRDVRNTEKTALEMVVAALIIHKNEFGGKSRTGGRPNGHKGKQQRWCYVPQEKSNFP